MRCRVLVVKFTVSISLRLFLSVKFVILLQNDFGSVIFSRLSSLPPNECALMAPLASVRIALARNGMPETGRTVTLTNAKTTAAICVLIGKIIYFRLRLALASLMRACHVQRERCGPCTLNFDVNVNGHTVILLNRKCMQSDRTDERFSSTISSLFAFTQLTSVRPG